MLRGSPLPWPEPVFLGAVLLPCPHTRCPVCGDCSPSVLHPRCWMRLFEFKQSCCCPAGGLCVLVS